MVKTNTQPKTDMADKLVYSFGDGSADGKGSMRELLGGKGANLAEMCSLGLPVPPGFTITTEVCVYYYAKSAAGVGALGRARLDAGHDGYGAQPRPQRRHRRSAGEKDRRPRFAYDSYRRFIQMYSDVVLGSITTISRKCSTA
jgi:pyruvate,orthophosphate dikinase